MHGIETKIWTKFRDSQFLFVAVHVGANVHYASSVYETDRLTLPMVFDPEQVAFDAYRQLDGVSPLFPLNVLVGKDGRVVKIISDALDFATLDSEITDALAR